jgi:hypothetical protein
MDTVLRPGWVFELGLSDRFETRMKMYEEGFDFANFSSNYVNAKNDEDIRNDLINIIKQKINMVTKNIVSIADLVAKIENIINTVRTLNKKFNL